ncbi:MAG: hypothetical protein Q9175_004301, partial [Cornicularia normoerica]
MSTPLSSPLPFFHKEERQNTVPSRAGATLTKERVQDTILINEKFKSLNKKDASNPQHVYIPKTLMTPIPKGASRDIIPIIS